MNDFRFGVTRFTQSYARVARTAFCAMVIGGSLILGGCGGGSTQNGTGGGTQPTPTPTTTPTPTPTPTVTPTPTPTASPAASVIGDGMGVQVQSWYLQSGDLGAIETAGFSVLRWGIEWESIEKQAGVYDWSAIDAFVQRLDASNLRSVVMLGFGNRLYSPTYDYSGNPVSTGTVVAGAPTSATARTAFLNFVRAAATRYAGKRISWEIWNEPDSPVFWAPSVDVTAYAELAADACKTIKSVSPSAVVIGPASASMPNAVAYLGKNLFTEIVTSGALDCLNQVSSHSYRMSSNYNQPDPESVTADNTASQTYLQSLNYPASKPWITTEWGFSTYNISANLQAAYLIRANLINAASGIPLTVWYEWRDSRNDASNPESHFGLLSYQGSIKNSLNAFSTLAQVSHSTYIRTLSSGRTNVYAFLLQNGSNYYIAAWVDTADENLSYKLLLNNTQVAVVNFMPKFVPVTSISDINLSVE